MAITAPPTPGTTPGKAPIGESFDAKAASQKSGGTERPGFDLGGSKDPDALKGDTLPAGSSTLPGGSRDPVPAGTDAARSAGATGMTEGNSRSTGGTAGGSKPGEATQATPGAVRPPQTTSADQTDSQGNPDDAA